MVQQAVNTANAAGIHNISVDIIYGLPEESMEELSRDIAACLCLNVPHLSAYSLSVNPGSIFHNKGYREADDDIQAKMYQKILKSFRAAGYERYEVSNFARPGFKSRHNLTYWHDEEYVACGLGASGYEEGFRYTNTKNLRAYLEGNHGDVIEAVSEEDDLTYYLLTNLRLAEGFGESSFEARFGFPFLSKYGEKFRQLEKDGLLKEENGRIQPTDRGILLLDRILLALI